MRRPLLIFCAMIACWFTLPAHRAFAQYGGGGGPARPGSNETGAGSGSDDDAENKKKDDEWNQTTKHAPNPGSKNAGPCPYVKVLYDAGRYVEFKDNKVASNAVGYTGELENLSSGCAYKGAEPINVEIELLFGFGRGPQAASPEKTYRYWVAVTDRNQEVLAKQYFDIKADIRPRSGPGDDDGPYRRHLDSSWRPPMSAALILRFWWAST